MEQAVNQFNKGLQTDTHPMVQSNDTLSDALNATFVTMNGNEVVLQNDMGNRRVDNAYLPSGYEPVGIKEYGGIIYIAAYNPITNRSQIGSFPSPERRIGMVDENLGGNLVLGVGGDYCFKSHPVSSLGGIECLNEDTVLIPLTKDTSLHAGDKFIVYNKNLNLNKSTITNYNNIDDTTGQVESPKNKCYTLALGILNSQNEFVDITSSLVRWEQGQNRNDIMNLEGRSDLYKFNAGYFIYSGTPAKLEIKENQKTEKDTLLDKERELSYQVYKANTYSYKLVGPLYLQAKVNHITDFSYNIFGTYDGKDAEIYVEGIITYNCPDGCNLSGKDTGGDDNYETYNEGLIKTSLFDFIVENNTYNTVNKCTKCKYDSSTNQYKVKQVLKYTCSNKTSIDYVIGVRVNTDVNNTYLEGLSASGTLDLTKLGSGEIDLKGWRFINNYKNKTGTITYTLDAYPKIGERFKNLKLTFTNVENGTNKYIHTIPQVNNGRTSINVEWNPEIWTDSNPNKKLLYNRALYEVKFSVETEEIKDFWEGYENNNAANAPALSGTEQSPSTYTPSSKNRIKEKTEFYLTTELFNSCYSSRTTNSDFVVDYGYPRGEKGANDEKPSNNGIKDIKPSDNPPHTGEKAVMAKKLLIEYNIDTNTTSNIEDDEINIKSKLLVDSNSSENPYIQYETSKLLNINLEERLSFKEELYPSWITISQEGLKINYSTLTATTHTDEIYLGTTEDLEVDITSEGYPKITEKYSDSSTITIVEKSVRPDYHKGYILAKIAYKDIFKAKPKDVILKDCHTAFKNVFEEFTKDMWYAEIFPEMVEEWGDDNHYVKVIATKEEIANTADGGNGNNEKADEYYHYDIFKHVEDDDPVNFLISEYYGRMIEHFNTYLGKNTIFTWQYNSKEEKIKEGDFGKYICWVGDNEIRGEWTEISNDYTTARIWWKTIDGRWALFNMPKLPLSANYRKLISENGPATRIKSGSNYIHEEKELIMYHIGDPHFAFYKEVNSADLQKQGPDAQNYKYNDRYNIDIIFKWTVSLKSDPIDIEQKGNLLIFEQIKKEDFSLDQEYTISLQSNEDFQDAASNIIDNKGYVSNLDIDTGLSKDSDGYELLPGRIYDYIEGQGLVRRVGKNIAILNDYSENNRAIVYSGSNLNPGWPQYDWIRGEDDNDGLTSIEYDSLVTVQNVK